MDWELASTLRHLAVLRHRKLFSYSGRRLLAFKVELELAPGEEILSVTARPSRLLRSTKAHDIERHGPIPFLLFAISECSGSPARDD